MPFRTNARSGSAPGRGCQRLRVTEIFVSLQGESRSAGFPTAFVRLTGCPLRCVYCDTAYAFSGGEWMSLDAIVARVDDLGAGYATVTGGEPLAQDACHPLLSRLCDRGYRVSLETGGSMDIADVDPRVSTVMDIKTPGSGESERNRYENVPLLGAKDQVKFVICDRGDYEWSREKVHTLSLASRCEVLFSPCHGALDAACLADWVLADRLPVRLQIQLHKLLWGDVPGR